MCIVVDSRVCTICKGITNILLGTDGPQILFQVLFSKFLYIINKHNTFIVVVTVYKYVVLYIEFDSYYDHSLMNIM